MFVGEKSSWHFSHLNFLLAEAYLDFLVGELYLKMSCHNFLSFLLNWDIFLCFHLILHHRNKKKTLLPVDIPVANSTTNSGSHSVKDVGE